MKEAKKKQPRKNRFEIICLCLYTFVIVTFIILIADGDYSKMNGNVNLLWDYDTSNPNKQDLCRWNHILEILDSYIFDGSKILDIGARNKFTEMVEERFDKKVDSTDGDLDIDFTTPDSSYTDILYLAVMEHQFNPLNTMFRLRELLPDDYGVLFVSLPERGKLLWTKGHFHELDDYRFRLLAERSGFEITNKYTWKTWRDWTFYFKGIRPLYRLIREHNVLYVLKKGGIWQSKK